MKVEEYLILNKYFLNLFGKEKSKDLFDFLKNVDENFPFDTDDISPYARALSSLRNLWLSEEKLFEYDRNITEHIKKINRLRKFQPKYFQYLALLFTEIFLDRISTDNERFLDELNEFSKECATKNHLEREIAFQKNDLYKLAFWMATGSGKTLIMHVNYYQFLHYNIFTPDNILLITPNETLSKQHLNEFHKSGIPAKIYDGTLEPDIFSSKRGILIIEITKLAEEKRGGGITRSVDEFDGRSLIFVDEGHKGKKSDEQKWAKIRDRLSENGFVFEYSATFGQILNEKNKELLEEYSKAIIFDYSYKYFYLDGYGKDFYIFNLKKAEYGEEEYTELALTGALLYYFQQLLLFEDKKEIMKEYNFEKPLFIFVGSTVTGKELNSDIIKILDFLKKTIENKKGFVEFANTLFSPKSGFVTELRENPFADKFEYLIQNKERFQEIYSKVFGGDGSLEIYEIKNSEGEFGLKIQGRDYFGVVNIGNVSDFKKMMEQKGYTILEDKISSSLFQKINEPDSNINILVGSKKFIEGWDTWRVSTMGLLNIGKGAGPQIIQLFGRGVRIKGKDYSLKRSGSIDLVPMETVGIFGIRANYLESFLKMIRKEEVEYEEVRIPVFIQFNNELSNLKVPFIDHTKNFVKDSARRLKFNTSIEVVLDLRPKFAYMESQRKEVEKSITVERENPEAFVGLELFKYGGFIDWEKVLLELSQFKSQKRMWNLIFEIEDLKEIFKHIGKSDKLSIKLSEIQKEKITENPEELTEITVRFFKNYITKFYKREHALYEKQCVKESSATQISNRLIDSFIKEETEDSQIKYTYVVKVRKDNEKAIKHIRNLRDNISELLKENTSDKYLPRILIDRSVYIPLLIRKETEDIGGIIPDSLQETEVAFLNHLRNYLNTSSVTDDYDLFVLRNLPFKGVGFQLKSCGFYPDFIVWLVNRKTGKQIVIFVDPHSLFYEKEGLNSEKVKFVSPSSSDSFVNIKQIEKQLNDPHLQLEAFLISTDPYNKDESRHVLFLDKEGNYIKKMFELIGITENKKYIIGKLFFDDNY